MVRPVRIREVHVGPGYPCFVIAEVGVNHNGNVDLALEMIDVAARAGADAVKFQTFVAEELTSAGAETAPYQRRVTGSGRSQLEMLKDLQLPLESFALLQRRCGERGIMFLSTPFDGPSLKALEELDVPAIKVSSGDLTNLPFLAAIGAGGRPVLLSTGMGTMDEVAAAVATVRRAGRAEVVLLHCVSRYPTPPEDVNLRAIDALRSAFGMPVGFSDHTLGIEITLAAVAVGAAVIEKHFTLDKTLPGPDHQVSIEPDGLVRLVTGIRAVEAALGDGIKRPVGGEDETARVARRSLVAARVIKAGEVIVAEVLSIKRPGDGIAPSEFSKVVGRTAARDIDRDAVLCWDDLM